MKINLKLTILYFLFLICSLSSINGQVGIGTNNPQNTLHVIPEDSNEDPLKIEDLNRFMLEDSSFLVVDPGTGIIRHLDKDSIFTYLGISIDQSITNELQIADEVPLVPSIDIDNDGQVEINVQEALEVIHSKSPKGTFKSIAEAKSAGLVLGDSFYTHPQGVFGCSGCIITLLEGM